MSLDGDVAVLFHAVVELLSEPVDAAGGAGDVSVGKEPAERLAHLEEHGALSRARGRESRRKAGAAAAADDDLGVKSLARCEHN